ncbi:MAG: DUF4007 family protein [Elusimicrobiota bacterium]|nr:MAG: DUF4007 family protein [Elusimicrobiota bacterium]
MHFAGHESFHIREGWLRKGLLAVQGDPFVFSKEYPEDILGVGHNMVSAIRYWLRACGLANGLKAERGPKNALAFELTPLANRILKVDPYFEDDQTWALLHYQLATNRDFATTWYWTFNKLTARQFDQELVVNSLKAFIASQVKTRLSDSSLERDFYCLTRTYSTDADSDVSPEDSLDCPMSRLNLVEHLPSTKVFRMMAPKLESLTPPIFYHCLLQYRESKGITSPTLSFQEVLRGELSPGRVFNFDAETLFEHLSRLSKVRLLDYSKAAGLNTITLIETKRDRVLSEYYAHGGVLA